MSQLRKFKNFSKNIGRISDYLNSILEKGGKFASDVWDATKREKEETKIAIGILSRMLRGDEVSHKEKKFFKEQSKDIIKIIPLVAIQGIPIPVPIMPLLLVLGKKYGLDLLPKDHRGILDDKTDDV